MQASFACLHKEPSNTVKQSNHTKLVLITFSSSKKYFSLKNTRSLATKFDKIASKFHKTTETKVNLRCFPYWKFGAFVVQESTFSSMFYTVLVLQILEKHLCNSLTFQLQAFSM